MLLNWFSNSIYRFILKKFSLNHYLPRFYESKLAYETKSIFDLQQNPNYSKFIIKFYEYFLVTNKNNKDLWIVSEYCEVNSCQNCFFL